VYYWHTERGETQWERPSGYESNDDEATAVEQQQQQQQQQQKQQQQQQQQERPAPPTATAAAAVSDAVDSVSHSLRSNNSSLSGKEGLLMGGLFKKRPSSARTSSALNSGTDTMTLNGLDPKEVMEYAINQLVYTALSY
jgi:hypothetical protein